MVNFFKNFAKGILYVLVLPFLLVILALYFGVSIIIFCYLGIKGIILFLTGRNLFGDFIEDIEAKRILNGEVNNVSQTEEEKPLSENNSSSSNNNINLYPNGYTTNIYSAVFGNEEEKPLNNNDDTLENQNEIEEKPTEIETNNINENNNEQEEGGIETEPEEEIIGRYVPFTEKKNRNVTPKQNENNDDEGGVSISDYDGGDN